MVQHVVERLAGNAHAKRRHVREVRQALPARLVLLAEDHFLLGTMLGAPDAARCIVEMQLRTLSYDRTADYDALMVKRNAPRWIRMLRRYGYIVPVDADLKAA